VGPAKQKRDWIHERGLPKKGGLSEGIGSLGGGRRGADASTRMMVPDSARSPSGSERTGRGGVAAAGPSP
jgi:hypothetical protein